MNPMQVEYVHMERKQEDTYKEAIEEYRAASQARVLKLSSKSLNSLAKALPKRQISNYFTQFRKVIALIYDYNPHNVLSSVWLSCFFFSWCLSFFHRYRLRIIHC